MFITSIAAGTDDFVSSLLFLILVPRVHNIFASTIKVTQSSVPVSHYGEYTGLIV